MSAHNQSDEDSLYEESPVDGYFSSTHVPHRTYVETVESPPQFKAGQGRREEDDEEDEDTRETATEALTQPTPSRLSPVSTTVLTWMSEVTSFLDTEAPPPAYSDIQGTRSRSRGDHYASSTRDMGRIGEREPLAHYGTGYGTLPTAPPDSVEAGRLPESMARPRDFDDNAGGSPRGVRKLPSHRLRKGLLIAIVVLVIALMVVLAALLVKGTNEGHTNIPGHDGDDSSPTPIDPTPSHPPPGHTAPGNGEVTPDPGKAVPTIPPNIPSPGRSSACAFRHHIPTQYYSFPSLNSFSLEEGIKTPRSWYGGIDGFIRILPANKDQSEDVVVAVDYATSSPLIISDTNIERRPDTLRLGQPRLVNEHSRGSQTCMDIYVNIFLKHNVKLTHFNIETVHLGVDISDNVFSPRHVENSVQTLLDVDEPAISNTSAFVTVSGKVTSGYWSSRQTRVETISGSITGSFALRDLLFIKSQSGSISVDIEPKAADEAAPAPAELTLRTTSASINVRTPMYGDIPEREYQTNAESVSGSVTGSFIHGSLSKFKTTSGSITTTILPYFADKFASTLETFSRDGHISVKMYSPHKDHGKVINRMRSDHTTTSGGIDLYYPREWEGTIDGMTISGSLTVTGTGMDWLNDRRPWGKHFEGRKGEGNSTLEMASVSGSINADFSDAFHKRAR